MVKVNNLTVLAPKLNCLWHWFTDIIDMNRITCMINDYITCIILNPILDNLESFKF